MINWVGGKGVQAKWIIKHFPEGYERMVYVEPFGGAGWVLLNKKPSLSEVYNDMEGNLVNLFRVVRDKEKQFEKLVNMTLRSKAEKERGYKLLQSGEINNLDDLHRALYFALNFVIGYGGYNSASFRRYKEGYIKYGKKAGADWRSFKNKLKWVSERLQDVAIENTDWEKCILTYDSKSTFFYVDPPYMNKKLYDFTFDLEEHKQLFDVLHKIKGKFLLSYYPEDIILEWYDGYNIDMKQVSTTVDNKSGGRNKKIEILIYNYNIKGG